MSALRSAQCAGLRSSKAHIPCTIKQHVISKSVHQPVGRFPHTTLTIDLPQPLSTRADPRIPQSTGDRAAERGVDLGSVVGTADVSDRYSVPQLSIESM